jgi:hypothetical protein
MKIALCFLVSYTGKLNKEDMWREWIEANEDIINVYVHYKDLNKCSPWLQEKAIAKEFIVRTDYMHVVPAYLSLLKYGIKADKENEWFCFLTEACVPIVSPSHFRRLFFENHSKSIMSWKKAWWNVWIMKRAELHLLPTEYHLANCPWFVLCKQDAEACIEFSQTSKKTYETICKGNVANESVFAIALKKQNRLEQVISAEVTATDWTRMMSPTSPYLFTKGDETDKTFIDSFLENNPYTLFLRKVDPRFPDSFLREYIK